MCVLPAVVLIKIRRGVSGSRSLVIEGVYYFLRAAKVKEVLVLGRRVTINSAKRERAQTSSLSLSPLQPTTQPNGITPQGISKAPAFLLLFSPVHIKSPGGPFLSIYNAVANAHNTHAHTPEKKTILKLPAGIFMC